MKIELEESGRGGRYVVAGDGEAELTFHIRADGAISADRTYVPESRRGQGIAAKLVERLVTDARARGRKVAPACSYVEAAFRRHPDWADLLA